MEALCRNVGAQRLRGTKFARISGHGFNFSGMVIEMVDFKECGLG